MASSGRGFSQDFAQSCRGYSWQLVLSSCSQELFAVAKPPINTTRTHCRFGGWFVSLPLLVSAVSSGLRTDSAASQPAAGGIAAPSHAIRHDRRTFRSGQDRGTSTGTRSNTAPLPRPCPCTPSRNPSGFARGRTRSSARSVEQRNVHVLELAIGSEADGHYGATRQLVGPLDPAAQPFDFSDRPRFVQIVCGDHGTVRCQGYGKQKHTSKAH
jgi:hypothetical protein